MINKFHLRSIHYKHITIRKFKVKMFKENHLSRKYHRTCNIQFITPLLKIANIICFFPPYNFERNFEENTSVLSRSTCYLIYSTAFGCSCFSLRAMSVYFLLQTNHEKNIRMFLEFISRCLFTLLAFSVNFGMVLWNRKKYHWLLNSMSLIEREIKLPSKPRHNFLILDIFLVHVSFGLACVFSYCASSRIMSNHGVHLFDYVLVYFTDYCLIMYVLVLINLTSSVNCKFEAFNDKLQKFSQSTQTVLEVRQLQKMFMRLSELVNLINDTFGVPMVIMELILLISSLECVQFAMTMGFQHKPLMATATMWVTFSMVM